MNTTITTSTIAPAGTWSIDPAHSKVGFAVKHMGIATEHPELAFSSMLVSDKVRLTLDISAVKRA